MATRIFYASNVFNLTLIRIWPSATLDGDIGRLCNTLSSLLPDSVVYPNSSSYIAENTYWSDRQGEVSPACFVTPRSTANVSAIVKSLVSLQAPFSVKAGGHTAFAGGSNVDQGVTIDLLYMTDIVVTDDSQTVSVGPGARWIQVTEALDPLGLAVVGGRVSDVGVSGLLLGGGISYFSGFRGWACDNVQNYEVVLSSGEVVNASLIENSDLFWALRGGGGSNFGIVTRFDLDAFPQGEIWSNDVVYPGALNTTLIPLYANLTINGLPEDPQAHMYFITTYYPELGGYVVAASLYHATPPAANTTPAVYAPLKSVPGILSDTSTVENVSTALRAINQPYGDRQTWWVTSVKVTGSTLLTDIVPLWEEAVSTLLSAADEIAGPNGTASKVTPYLVFQPIPINVLTAMQQNGGNALGLKPSDGPLTLVQLTLTWDSAELDDLIEDEMSKLIDKVETVAEERGESKGFVYMNYAGSTQKVFERYGPENFERLRDVAEKYDPDGLLQQYWKGYFQLSNE
ncbi:hypothetical protein Daus18300_009378 [Diaporthe australafricana]|uniref:FAD-binding PCMH-type domain-containing protein n=1 Tax=Diaporthe australafricana TaxID=127596 RepID=A0ABR3WF17_9PEZI